MDNYPEITEYFNTLIENSRSIDLAEAEFKRIISDDPKLKELYRDWCHENGHRYVSCGKTASSCCTLMFG